MKGMSSKRAVIDEGVKSVVDGVIVPIAGWDRIQGTTQVTTQ